MSQANAISVGLLIREDVVLAAHQQQKAPRQFAGRGPSYWTDGREERIIVVTPGYHMISLDAKTGLPDPRFGTNGVVDLME